MSCCPGPATILTDEQEERLKCYLVQMSEIGFGLTREDITHLAFNIAEKCHQAHLLKMEKLVVVGLMDLWRTSPQTYNL